MSETPRSRHGRGDRRRLTLWLLPSQWQKVEALKSMTTRRTMAAVLLQLLDAAPMPDGQQLDVEPAAPRRRRRGPRVLSPRVAEMLADALRRGRAQARARARRP